MKTSKPFIFKIVFYLPLIAAVFCAAGVQAEEETKKTPQSSKASGGMTYSPTQGWVKTSEQMQVGTDALVYDNQKKIIAAAVKQNREKIAREKAAAAEKEKAAKEAEEVVPDPPQETPTYKSRVFVS